MRQLAHERAHVLASVDGLDDAALTTSVVPSGWTPAGVIQHLALESEGFFFRTVLTGQSAARAGDPDRAWDVAPGAGLAAIERYRQECALADQVIGAHSPADVPVAWPDELGSWRLANLYEMVLHVVSETACHAGHLDIARELIDGTQYLVID